jgi:hypothetical protein
LRKSTALLAQRKKHQQYRKARQSLGQEFHQQSTIAAIIHRSSFQFTAKSTTGRRAALLSIIIISE